VAAVTPRTAAAEMTAAQKCAAVLLFADAAVKAWA
jgi:hypothetical protein